MTNFGFNIPARATINGITATLVTTGSNNPYGGAGIQLTKNGTTAVGTAPAASSGWSSGSLVIGSSTNLWGTTWSAADINSANFGLLVQPSGQNSGEVFRIYHRKIAVSYTVPTQPPSSLSFTAIVGDNQIAQGNQTYSISLSNPTTTDPGGAALGASSVSTTVIDNDIAFSITGGSSVYEDPTLEENQVSYTISYAGTLGPAETASVDVNEVLGSIAPSQFSTDAIAAINSAVAGSGRPIPQQQDAAVLPRRWLRHQPDLHDGRAGRSDRRRQPDLYDQPGQSRRDHASAAVIIPDRSKRR